MIRSMNHLCSVLSKLYHFKWKIATNGCWLDILFRSLIVSASSKKNSWSFCLQLEVESSVLYISLGRHPNLESKCQFKKRISKSVAFVHNWLTSQWWTMKPCGLFWANYSTWPRTAYQQKLVWNVIRFVQIQIYRIF